MSFTDEDLKRLKKAMEVPYGLNLIFKPRRDLVSLLHRLEAAERVCEASAKVVRPKERIGNAPLERAIYDALQAWLSACGKGPQG